MTRLPKRCCASRSSSCTAATYCANRGLRNFGSVRRRSSPSKTVSACIRPDRSPRHSAPYPSVAILFGFDSAFEQVVGWLQHMQRRNAAKPLHLADRKVAHADGADFPLLEQRVHCFRGLLDRNQWVGPMNLVDVNVIGSKPAQ